MSPLNACLKVANIAEASGVPYVENVAKVALVALKLLEQKGKNKKSADELCESIADTIVVIDTLVRRHGDQGTLCYSDSCGEMEKYLQSMMEDIKSFKLKHRGFRGFFRADNFRDIIRAHRRRVDDLKTDFLIHSVGDCNSKVTQIHCLLMNATPQAAYVDLQHIRGHIIAFAKRKYTYQEVHLQAIDVFLVILDDAVELVNIKKALPYLGYASFRSRAMRVK
ncbi:hypothetical protein EDD85DRAFT_1029196 [Armillaria nabsnona]|nr:hypothetical protein EDD85DRAFT_1029196 [Armillaria nabsnona]